MSRPLEIADSIDTLAMELSAIDGRYFETCLDLRVNTEKIRALTPPDVRLWSDPRSWPSGRVPTRTDNVTIDTDIVIDRAECRRLDIRAGTATLADGGRLDAYDGSVVVWDGAALRGTTGTIAFHVTDDRLFVGNTRPGPRPEDPDDHSDTDYGLWGLDGSTINLSGPEVLPWTEALSEPSAAGTVLGYGVRSYPTVGVFTADLGEDPVGWKKDDTLLLVPLQGQAITATLVWVSGRRITWQTSTQTLLTAWSRANRVICPKIANLSRRLRIVSADVTETAPNRRAHVALMHHGHYHLRNVELRNLGPRGKLGRYPVHFHHAGHAEHGSGAENCSIWQNIPDPGNRGIAIHNTQGAVITGNVIYRSRGHAVFMEDSREHSNTVRQNLVVETSGPEELAAFNSPVGSASHHYWLYTGNVIEGNTAVGREADGFVINPAPTRPGQEAVATLSEAINCRRYGMWSKCRTTHWALPIAVNCSTAGIAFSGSFDFPCETTLVSDPALWLNGSSDTHYPPYQCGTYSNLGGIITVDGGQVAGPKEAFHVHYQPSDMITFNVDVESDQLFNPTYWYNCLRKEGGTFKGKNFFVRQYPLKYHGPGFAIIDGVYCVGPLFAHYPTFEGIDRTYYRELANPIRQSGFIPAPTGTKMWTLVPVGSSVPATKRIRRENQRLWEQTVNAWQLGYPDGFPPGRYVVEYFGAGDVLLGSGIVEVRSGEVSSLP